MATPNGVILDFMPANSASRWSTPLAFTVLAWGFNFPAITLLYKQMSAPALSLVRFLVMLCVLVPIAWFSGHSVRYDRQDAFRMNALGFLSMGLYMVVFLEGMKHSNPAEAAIVLSTSPLWVNLIRVLLKKQAFSMNALIGALIAIVGVTLVVIEGHDGRSSTWLGHALMLAAAVLWAYCVVLSQPLIEKYGPVRSLAACMPSALLILVPYGLREALATPFGDFRLESWIMLGHIALMAGMGGFLGFYAGVKKIGPSNAMLYQFFVPPTAAICSWLVLGRPLVVLQAIGLAVVILGVWISTRNGSIFRRRAGNSSPA